jgi:hypothetical protein
MVRHFYDTANPTEFRQRGFHQNKSNMTRLDDLIQYEFMYKSVGPERPTWCAWLGCHLLRWRGYLQARYTSNLYMWVCVSKDLHRRASESEQNVQAPVMIDIGGGGMVRSALHRLNSTLTEHRRRDTPLILLGNSKLHLMPYANMTSSP